MSKIFDRKFDGKRLLARSKRRWEIKVNYILKKFGVRVWTAFICFRIQIIGRDLANTVINLGVA